LRTITANSGAAYVSVRTTAPWRLRTARRAVLVAVVIVDAIRMTRRIVLAAACRHGYSGRRL
jgi:hypothetical protein